VKILHLANHCHRIGNGIMNVAVDLACEQSRLGHEVVFASAGGSFVELMQGYGVRHVEIAQYWREPLAALRGAWRLRRLLDAFKPDIVHAHMKGGALLASLFNRPRRFGLVTSLHNEWQRAAKLMGVADRVIAVSEASCAAMRARGLTEAQLRTVRNGPIGSPRALSDAAPTAQLKRPALLTVCGLYRRKGVLELIEAFAAMAGEHESAHLYIAGDGPDRAVFEQAAGATGLASRIAFLGYVENPAPLFAQADVFVLASHSEPFGLVLAEARAAGCAIIGADTGGVPEVLEHGAAGVLVPPKDPAALAEAMRRLLGDDEARRSYQRRAAENLDWLGCARMTAETLSVYRELIDDLASGAAALSRAKPWLLPRVR
jgi:glycosyltransferase involved in cell wall biosynthesis